MRTRLLVLLASAAIAACSSSGPSAPETPYTPGPPPPPPTGCEITGCVAGSYCDTVTHTCKTGCATSGDCSVTGQACGADHVCRCPSDQHVCGSACVSSSSVATCGTRCTPCPEPSANGHATCGGWFGSLGCLIACDDPAARVCGTECVTCPGAGSFECGPTPGTCIATSCLAGYHRAGDGCLPWEIEPVAIETDTMPISSDAWSSLAVDPAGVPEVAWASYGAGVYHERRGGTGWTRTKIAPSGWNPLIAIDAAGTSQVLFAAQVTVDTSLRYDLVYVREADGAFSPDGVATLAQGLAGPNNLGPLAYALALDASGVPHVAYWDGTAGKLRHGVRGAGGTWSLEDVGSSSAGAMGLAVDGAGRVHVAYRDDGARSLVYTVKDAGSWSAPETVDLAGGAGATGDIEDSVSLAVDANGRPRIAYVAPYPQLGSLVYIAQRTATSWAYSPANGGSVDMDEEVTIAVDSQGRAHLAFESSGDVEYLAPSGPYWAVYVAYAGINGAGHVGFALDAQDRPHLAWSQYRTAKQTIWYAR